MQRASSSLSLFNRVLLVRLALLAGLMAQGCSYPGTNAAQTLPANIRPAAASDRSGTPTGGWCNRLPKVSVESHSSQVQCIGLIDNQLGFPRGVLAWNNDIIVVDKGTHLHQQRAGERAGKVWRYTPTATGFKRSLLLEGLNNPSSLSRGKHARDKHFLYVSTPTAILRFAPDGLTKAAPERVIEGLPLTGWHYLSAAYATPEYLFVTIPSASDHCETAAPPLAGETNPRFPCPEVSSLTHAGNSTATIRRYAINSDGSVAKAFTLLARGLRDALAMTLTNNGRQLIVADNGWDNIADAALGASAGQVPLDELNLLRTDSQSEVLPHFGWPYCYQHSPAAQAITPGYAPQIENCSAYKNALQTLPAHSAPLSLLRTQRQLLVNLHGFVAAGRKTLGWTVDDFGLPVGAPNVLIDWNYSHVRRYVGGRPFGLANYGDNALLITDDWNRSLMIVYLADTASADQAPSK